MFIEALFTIAKTWKQTQCPATDEQIKIGHIYTMEYYSATKKSELMPFAAAQMDLDIIMLSEVKSEANIVYHLHVESKYDPNELIYETETDKYKEQPCGC